MPFRLTYFYVGSIILVLSWPIFLLASVGVLSEEWRVVATLEANPHYYLGYIRNILLYGMLPPAIGLIFCIAGTRSKARPRDWRLSILGAISSFLWGVLILRAAYSDYTTATHWTNTYHVSYINSFLLAIYVTFGMVGVLWLFAGLFFAFLGVYGKKRTDRISIGFSIIFHRI